MTRNHYPVVLVGNSLSVMVAAIEVARQGTDVAIVHGGKGWGGHFSTVSSNGASFDIGMVLYEFTSYNSRGTAHDVRTYDPSIRNDAGRFCQTVQAYIDRHQSTHTIATPNMYVAGEVHEDILIANALTALKHLPFAPTVRDELQKVVAHPPAHLHASHKHVGDDFTAFDYHTASLANHGETFHARLIEPFSQKLLGLPTDDILALYHRVAWLPLYYPETLLSFMQGTPQTLPPTVFSYPDGECVGNLAYRLKAKMDADKRVTVLPDRLERIEQTDDDQFTLRFSGRDHITADRLAWANSLSDALRVNELSDQVETYEKASITLAFVLIRENALNRDFTVLSIVDPDISTYRVTNQSRCGGERQHQARLVVELNPDYAASRNGPPACDISNAIAQDLVVLKIIRSARDIDAIEVKQMTNALMLPTARNHAAMMHEMSAVRGAAPCLSLMGPASGFFSSSLNDQIVQGLKFANQAEAPL
jgi:hypothetical protein